MDNELGYRMYSLEFDGMLAREILTGVEVFITDMSKPEESRKGCKGNKQLTLGSMLFFLMASFSCMKCSPCAIMFQ